jgi:hypothetical protein
MVSSFVASLSNRPSQIIRNLSPFGTKNAFDTCVASLGLASRIAADSSNREISSRTNDSSAAVALEKERP